MCSGRGVSVRAIAFGLLSMAQRELHLVVDPSLVRPVDAAGADRRRGEDPLRHRLGARDRPHPHPVGGAARRARAGRPLTGLAVEYPARGEIPLPLLRRSWSSSPWWPRRSPARPLPATPSHRRGARRAGPHRDPTLAGVHLSWTVPNDNGGPIINYNDLPQRQHGAGSGGETLLADVGNVTTYDDTAAPHRRHRSTSTQVTAVTDAAKARPLERVVRDPTHRDPRRAGAHRDRDRSHGVHLSWTAPSDNGSHDHQLRRLPGTSTGTETFLVHARQRHHLRRHRRC